MLILILVIVVGLVSWSLHLMQEAVDQREFSLMLAGTLVAFSAAAMMSVYFLMGNYVGYIAQISHDTTYMSQSDIPITWSAEDIPEAQAFYQ
jgi:amino acid transporter